MTTSDTSIRMKQRGAAGTLERRRRHLRGRWAEFAAGLLLMGKGYRILGRRVKTGAGEVDLVAVRGNRLVFVEVKYRPSFEDAEAAIADRQRRRIRRAADLWLARHPRDQQREIGFDLVLMAPRRWPRHIENGL